MLNISKISEADSCPQVKQKQHEGMNTDEMANCNMNENYEAEMSSRSWLVDPVKTVTNV